MYKVNLSLHCYCDLGPLFEGMIDTADLKYKAFTLQHWELVSFVPGTLDSPVSVALCTSYFLIFPHTLHFLRFAVWP